MTGSVASRRGEREKSPSLLPLQRLRGCHPERARGTRASEGSAVPQSAKRVPSSRDTGASEGSALTDRTRATVLLSGRASGTAESRSFAPCGAQDDRLRRFAKGRSTACTAPFSSPAGERLPDPTASG